MNRDIGKNAERELVSILKSEGFYAVRIPTSNSSSNPLPDIFATKRNLLLAIECKSTWEDKVKVREIQIRKLFEFLSMFTMDGKAVIAVKFKNIHKWKIFEIQKIEEIVVTKDNSEFLENFLSLTIKKSIEENVV
ncbi:Holliday junction resolvase Hjc [Acidianus brierleyi]|uniref:Endonuclease n=1 Tax=Acidianus brierleyi TaxID=41673 RepID=A0A2U9IC71_9CREN|nr:Holliday junction resolvase Hjc [Acidianus brierleyi]AWR93616.1 endonuclease [Acidianus brierleyi]